MTIRAALFIMPVVLTVACTPATTARPSATTARPPAAQTGLKGPLPVGETWTISGVDQNRNKITGRVRLTRGPVYRAAEQRWDYDSANGYVLYYENGGGNATFRVWDLSNPRRLVACYVFVPFNAAQKVYAGAGLSGSAEEINAVFAKLSGSGTRLTGGACTVTRG